MKMRGSEYVNMTPRERLSMAIYGFGFTREGHMMTPEELLVQVLITPHFTIPVRVTRAIGAALFEGMTEDEEQDLRHAYLLPSKEGAIERDGEKVALESSEHDISPTQTARLRQIIIDARSEIDPEKMKECATKIRAREEARQKIALEKFHTSARRIHVHALVLGQNMT